MNGNLRGFICNLSFTNIPLHEDQGGNNSSVNFANMLFLLPFYFCVLFCMYWLHAELLAQLINTITCTDMSRLAKNIWLFFDPHLALTDGIDSGSITYLPDMSQFFIKSTS